LKIAKCKYQISKISKLIKIFPNPTDNKIRVNLGQSFTDKFIVEIYNTSGILTFSQVKEKNINEFDIDMKDYPDGMYLMRIFNKNKSIISKIIKQ
jgi:hypothetical protein